MRAISYAGRNAIAYINPITRIVLAHWTQLLRVRSPTITNRTKAYVAYLRRMRSPIYLNMNNAIARWTLERHEPLDAMP
ncbi:hypothetical protein [Nostoc sp. CCY0012]|uniref:hypothetical protein n=1 Tax=Nostoc sp. CCY0012 TaxID=1056123 RepID=UPI0039C5F57F